MKKLLSLAAVAAIVTSAFAFTVGETPFCVLNTAQTDCEFITGTSGSGVSYKHVLNFNGVEQDCIDLTKFDCTEPILIEKN